MKLFLLGLFFSCVLCGVLTEETRLIELEPDQAAQIINSQDQSLRYAPKVQSNVPGVRFIGDHPENVVEDIYLANQYHGQDGLGAYVYGYAIPDIAKSEKKERSGDLKGSYKYITGNGKEIKVEYWDNGNGFHQVDNVAQIQPQQVEDSPEVKAAKEEHFRIWREQAERNAQAPTDPYASQYEQPTQNPFQGQQKHQSQSYGSSQNQGQFIRVQNPQAFGAHPQAQIQRNPNSVDYNDGQYSTNQQTWVQGSARDKAGSVASASEYSGSRQGAIRGGNQQVGKQQEEEVTGPPKGFFYNFDYPVGIIVGREGKNLEAYYSQNKDLYEKQLKREVPAPAASSTGYHASA